MRLCEVKGLAAWLPESGVCDDAIWQRPAASISEMEITLFYARAGLKGQRMAAIEAIERAQTAIITALFDGKLEQGSCSALVLHEPPAQPFMVDEFIDGLLKMTPVRRAAVLFALEAKMEPVAVADLCWSHLPRYKLPEMCASLVQSQLAIRHIKLPYVFWEWASETIATPLLELTYSAEQAFGCSWPMLQARHERMIMVNRQADAASLTQLLNDLRGKAPT